MLIAFPLLWWLLNMNSDNNSQSGIKRFRSLFEEPIFIKDGDELIRIDCRPNLIVKKFK